MAEMKITQLNVDLLSGQANIAMSKQHDHSSNRPGFTNVSVMLPIVVSGDPSESHLKKTAIEEAKKALAEAMQALDRPQA